MTQSPASVPAVTKGRMLPTSAPMTNWPSAPMFQMLARKQNDRPIAMSSSGVAFTAISCSAQPCVSGSTKYTSSAARGERPISAMMMPPMRIDARSAPSGARTLA